MTKNRRKYSRAGKILTDVLYGYLTRDSLNFAKTQAEKKSYGSVSAYIETLICQARGVTPPTGLRGQKRKTVRTKCQTTKTRMPTSTKSTKKSLAWSKASSKPKSSSKHPVAARAVSKRKPTTTKSPTATALTTRVETTAA